MIIKIYNEWCLIDSTWGVGDNSDFYLCTPPEFFIRKHLPQESQQEFQLLNNPMTKEVYKDLAEVDKGFYKYNVTLIEDKYIQNICGKGKLTIKYNYKSKIKIELSSLNGNKFPNFFPKKLKDGLEINFYINEEGIYQFLLFGEDEDINFNSIAEITINCTEPPEQKIYYPMYYSPYYLYDGIELITPLNNNLIKGQSYNFEIKAEEYNYVFVLMDGDAISLKKIGGIFKVKDVYIHSDRVFICGRNNSTKNYGYEIINLFLTVGNNVEFPDSSTYRYSLDFKLISPLTANLYKGKTYKFKLRNGTDEKIRIYYNYKIIEFDKEGEYYSKTITIDSSTSFEYLKIIYYSTPSLTQVLYQFNIQ